MNKLKYSIIYAAIRPEISEQISLGLILVNNGRVKIRYSAKKLRALKGFYSANEYKFLSKAVRSLKEPIRTEEEINYMTRYSNNMLTVSRLQSIDLDSSNSNEDWLFRNYVYSGQKK